MEKKKKPAARPSAEQLHAQARYTSGNPVIIPNNPHLQIGEGGAWGAFSFPSRPVDDYDRQQFAMEEAKRRAWGYPEYGYQPPRQSGHRDGVVNGRTVPMDSPGAYGIGYVNLPWRKEGYNTPELMSAYASYSGRPVPSGKITSGGGGGGMNYSAQPLAVKKNMEAQRLASTSSAARQAAQNSISAAAAAAPSIAAAQAKSDADARLRAQKRTKDMRLHREITQQQSMPTIPLSEVLWGNPSWR